MTETQTTPELTTDLTTPEPTTARTLPGILAERAFTSPDRVAYVHHVDGEDHTEQLTYGELERDARARAAALLDRGLAGGRAVLAHDTGLDFVRDLFACFLAGVAAVPVQVPNRRHGVVRMSRIAADAGTSVLLTSSRVAERLADYADMPELAELTLVDSAGLRGAATWLPGDESGPDDLALLQYTSGSTGHPKGVEVTHRNFWHNTADILTQWPIPEHGRVASWLPLFHDLGLLFGAVLPVRAGVPVHLMSPGAFVRRPLRWLEIIGKHRVTHVAAPNFAFQMCLDAVAGRGVPAGLDLSSCAAALNGAEPVRWSTVSRFVEVFAEAGFRASAPAPAYGLAEATLHVTGTRQDMPPHAISIDAARAADGVAVPVPAGTANSLRVVSCGTPAPGTVVRVVDPVTRLPVGRRGIGEIWVRGPGVARGYWQRPAETSATFRAVIAGEGPETHLRTGDLGFLHDGELYVCGRHKDVLIRNGRNYYPNDLELAAEGAHPLLRAGSSAAFAVERAGRELFVLAVEVDGRLLRAVGLPELVGLVTAAVERDLAVVLDEVVPIQRGTLAKTTSGKVQRAEMRRQYLDGALSAVARGSGS
ncbi:fatty acyl-AMP ligase [Saccharothrix lopnurensis]|uniref:Fatty acyl-AMP ligase n=1 Tax=Saccharothrix lopnurensis TaxID=1670621 RepID=A0ABW1PGV0_9PSEU